MLDIIKRIRRDAVTFTLIKEYILKRMTYQVPAMPSEVLLKKLKDFGYKSVDAEMLLFAIIEDYFAGGQKFVRKIDEKQL